MARHVADLAAGLARRGWSVEVAAQPGSLVAAAMEQPGMTVHELEMARRPGPADLAAARRLRSLDRRGDYDLVHAHSSKAGGLVRAALPRSRRFVYTPHCFAFAAQMPAVERGLYWAAEQALVPRTRAIVAVSEWEARAGRRLLGAAGRLRLIENGVRACAEPEPHAGLREFAAGRPLAGMISVLRPQKAPLLAVEAMGRLASGGSPPGRLAIVGNGELAGEVESEIARRDLGEHVRLFPFEGDGETYLHALDLVVMPSLWESLPLGLLEAMRCGRPVLAAAVGGVPEALEDGRTGALVPPGEPERLADALGRLLADRGRLERLGRAARQEADRRFDVETMIARTADLYAELAGAR